jgi:hypothetical protein
MTKLFFTFSFLLMLISIQRLSAQCGFYDAPYKRYEADLATHSKGAAVTMKSYSQVDLQSEASDQICVDMKNTDATAEFILLEPADGMVIRYSVPDGESAVIGVYDGNIKITSLTLTSKWSWEYLWSNGDPNNVGVTNKNPRMRFDEVRYKLPNKLSKLKIVKESGNLNLDFIEMEPVPPELHAPEGAAVYYGDGSTLQAFIDANGSKTIYIPTGVYNINSQLYFGVSNTKLQGAGMWYSQINFTVTNASNGGLRANASRISYSDLFLTTDMTTRTNGYAGIHGVYTKGSIIRNLWVEHCATGAWIAQYVQGGGPAFADGFTISNCRFRNTYADGINLCKGTRNAIVEHCNFRNNGDDGMAIWCAEGLECINNTFRNNTVENGWRAAGAALYGGKDNKFYDIIIKDNVEIGITISNLFPGVGFNDNGMHDFHNISLIGCGTFNDTNNSRVGAINITGASSAGTKVQNIRFYNININDSKCDAIRFFRNSGTGFSNINFANTTVIGTGKEYPNNNANNSAQGRGYVAIFENNPSGSAVYCGMNYSNLGGNANGVAFYGIGNFKWTAQTGCDYISVLGVSLSQHTFSLAGGAKVQLNTFFDPGNATNQIVEYTSNNITVATVDYTGLVTAVGKGSATITVRTLEGGKTDTCLVTVTSDPTIVYKIKNRWQNTYLYDADDRVKYSVVAGNNSYLWQLEDIEGVKEIRNFSTGDYMNIENLTGYVQCTDRTPGTLSSEWLLEDAGDGFVRLKSKSDTINYIHIENLQSHAQYGLIADTWWSAMWSLEPEMIITSVTNLTLEKTAGIYPNPSNGDFNLSLSNFARNENVSITIFNLAGQAIYAISCIVDDIGLQNIKIDTGNFLTNGNYYILARGDSNFATAKLLISR